MKDFYYQIKGKRNFTDNDDSYTQELYGNWVFPPIFTGKVTAKDKKEAKLLIDEEYGKKFPQRVLKKDLESNEFLLNIEEIKPDSHIARLFEPQICIQCGETFYVIDKYNDHNTRNKGITFCSDKCKDENGKLSQFKYADNDALIGGAVPLIYKITNKATGMVYIGKTTQVFTLRWYQHFFHLGTNKFHDAIKNSKLSDWTFEIQEVIVFPEYISEGLKAQSSLEQRLKRYDLKNEMDKFILERERYWIDHFDSIANGYNSV